MIICDRCGWMAPVDCTCRRQVDERSVIRLEGVVAARHRESVARAQASGWRAGAPAEPEDRTAG